MEIVVLSSMKTASIPRYTVILTFVCLIASSCRDGLVLRKVPGTCRTHDEFWLVTISIGEANPLIELVSEKMSDLIGRVLL